MGKLIKFAEIRGRIGWKGYTIKDLRKEGPWVVGAGDINELNHLTLDNAKHLSREKYEESPEIFLKKDDLLVVKVGPIGKLAIIDEEIGEASINPNCVIVRPTKINPYYLFYFLCSPYGQKQLINNSAASVQSALNQKELANMEVPSSDEASQIKIGNLLHNLDKKIKNNKNISKKIDLLIKTIYDYWFLQFEFPDKHGKPYKSSGGKMVFNKELNREIPEGWEVKTFYDISKITWGQCPPGANILPLNTKEKDAIKYCSGAGDMRNGLIVDCQAKTNNSKRYADKGDILISIAGSIGATAYVNERISLGRAAASLTPTKCSSLFVLLTLQKYLTSFMNVSNGSIQKVINSDNIKNIVFPINFEILDKFKKFDIYLNKCINLCEQNNKLSALRNFLLPLLMNGQVKIK